MKGESGRTRAKFGTRLSQREDWGSERERMRERERRGQGGASRIGVATLHLRGVVFCNGCYVSNLNREIRLSARVYSCQALHTSLSYHKTRHCPSPLCYHLCYSHDTISLLRSNYTHLRCCRLSLALSLFLPSLHFSVALCCR